MKRPRVLLDVDGVLADFVGAWLSIVNSVTGQQFTKEDVDDWSILESFEKRGVKDIARIKKICNAATGMEGFCADLAVLDGAQEAVRQLQSMADVFIVTSPWHSKQWTYERDQWVKNHFGIKRDHVVHTSAKYLISGDFLVDDKIENILGDTVKGTPGWLEENPTGCGIVWEMPYNRGTPIPSGVMRTNNWDKVIEAVSWYGST